MPRFGRTKIRRFGIPNDGQTPLDVSFPEKKIVWVKFEVTRASPTTKNVGLSEIAIYDH